MVTRAFKHILRAVIAAVDNLSNLSAAIAAVLNILLGSSKGENVGQDLANDQDLKMKWLETFISKRYCWRLTEEFRHMRMYVLLRGLCQKVLQLYFM